MHKKRKLFKVLTALSTTTLLGACAVQQPCPVVEPVQPNETVVTSEPNNNAANTSAPAAPAATPATATPAVTPAKTAPATSSAAATSPATVTSSTTVSSSVTVTSPAAATIPVTPPASSSSFESPASSSSVTTADPKPNLIANPVDPYTAIPNIVSEVFDFANTLFEFGAIDDAISYLQKFRILKPLWNEWASRTDSLLNVFGMTNAERAKQFEPLILEIKNMNRVNAAYTLVAEAADSLIALAPGDSLINFAKQQKEIAYKNTIGKALKEKTDILSLAEAKARFEEALKQANEFKMRYRDFENELQIEKMIAYIQGLQNSISEEDKKYWEKNDPEKALAEVDTLIEKKSYAKAKTLVEKLKASKLRQQAAEKYQKLADAVCTDKRKAASLLYSQATKQKKPEKKKELLLKAIGDLNACSDDYPEYEKIKTVMDNIIFLKKELDR